MPIDEETAAQICDLYGIADGRPRQGFINYAKKSVSPVAGRILEFVAPKMRAAVKSDATRLINFARFLTGAAQFGPDEYERADCLLHTNYLFGYDWVTIDAGSVKLKDTTTEMINMHKDVSPSVKAFIQKRRDKAAVDILEFREAFIQKGAAATNAYEIIHYFHGHGIDLDRLTSKRCVKLLRLAQVAPVHTIFQGFAKWGSGDADDGQPATNLRNHFLKHVLDADPKGNRLHWKDELRRWWVELDIRLARRDAEKTLDAPSFAAVRAMFGPAATTADDATLPHAQVVAFLGAIEGAKMSDAFRNLMYDGHGATYRDRGLDVGRRMTDGMVHSVKKDERLLYVSGRLGDIYVAGRLDEDELRLSSCYFAEDIATKLADRIEIWRLHTS